MVSSHFDPGQFTSVAIDNWDHEGINVSEHDTVTVLLQDKSPSSTHKPKVSDTKVTHGPQAFKMVLPCQLLSKFYKPAHRLDLPAQYQVSDDEYASLETTTSRLKGILWSLLRIDLKNDQHSIYHQTQKVPSWCASNSVWTNEAIPEKTISFPACATISSDAIFHSIHSNAECYGHLLPAKGNSNVYCDEGVYCIVREIQLMRPEEFRSLVPCLGTFHLTKTVLKCIGKYLEGSGAELTWLKAGIFGQTLIEKSVLNDGHYSRCLEGMQLLSESLWRLLYQELFREKGTQPYILNLLH